MLGKSRPRVGLLSNGEEESKGNELTREAHELLKGAPFNYVGYVEGRDIFNGKVDVVACDGFVGNVDCKPHHLAQFALMGEVYARHVLGKSRPRVGLVITSYSIHYTKLYEPQRRCQNARRADLRSRHADPPGL